MSPVKALIRTLALIGKEIVEVTRRPGAVASLVLGPFLILAIFGLGYQGYARNLQAIVVVPPSSGLPQDAASYQNLGTTGVTVVGVTADQPAAEAQLRAQAVDLVIVAPANAQESLRQGKQAQLTIEMNLTDPVQANYASFLSQTVAADVNREILKRAAAEGQGYIVSIGGQNANIPPDVIAAPTVANVVNLAPIAPAIVPFFGLAALALVLQHMAVTLLALSIVRERTSGAMDLFRIAPIRATELVLGKVIAFGILGAVIAGLSVFLLVGLLHVPMLGPIPLIALTIGLLLAASLGLGLLISVVSDSERQAVQLSLLALLASMFFSGFVLRIDQFQPILQAAAYVIPATHGISLLQDLFLRGTVVHPWQLGALAVIAVVLLVASWALLRREMRPA
jgi:ABC-2 type transport system permease protein